MYQRVKKGEIVIKQDGTGGWATTWDSSFKFTAGSPLMDTGHDVMNVFKYTVTAADRILMEFAADYV